MSLRSLSCLFVALLCCAPAFADWRPISPADLALKAPSSDPHADAEALFREVRISNVVQGNSYPRNITTEYIRLKIFTEKGKEFGNVQVPYFGSENIYDVQGRTIRPDGSVVELKKDSVFKKVLEKHGAKTTVVSFAMPGVEPGSIVEYKFTKDDGERTYRYQPLEVQSEYPVDELTFFLKPLSSPYIYFPAMRYLPFGCNPEHGALTRDGFEVFRVRNVPAYHDEPFSLPNSRARQWILVYYEENSKSGKEQYWTSLGKEVYGEYDHLVKVNGEVKAIAAQIAAGAATDVEKLDKILQYCRTELKNTKTDEIAGQTQADAKANRTTADTIRRKQGTDADINYAFIALARALGFEARRVDLLDRATFLFQPAMQSRFFLNAVDAAVNVGGKWRFYDVSNPAVPGGQLRWQEQGVYGLVMDGKNPEIIQTPMLSSAENLDKRIAQFSLSEEGTLEGEVREMKYGSHAIDWRERNRFTNEAQREENLREELKQRFADFTLSNVKFTASADDSKPVGVTYHIVITHYAQLTGKRLFFSPDYFAVGWGSRFTDSVRHNSVYFQFPWSEADTIELKVPEIFELDHADAPSALHARPNCNYEVKMTFDTKTSTLTYERQMRFGNQEILVFEPRVYPTLKKVFDIVHDADNHMLTLKATGTRAAVLH